MLKVPTFVSNGELFITTNSHRVLKLHITICGEAGYNGDDQPATLAQFNLLIESGVHLMYILADTGWNSTGDPK